MGITVSNGTDLLLNTFDFLNIPVFIIDINQNVISINLTAGYVFQYTVGDIIGRNLSQFITSSKATIKTADHNVPRVFPGYLQEREITAEYYESVCRKKNSESFIAKVSVVPYQTDGQRLVVIQDISGQKKLQQKASQRTKELSIFNTFAKILTSHIDTDMIMSETIEMLLSIMEADAGWIYLTDDKTGELYLKAQKGFTESFMNNANRLKPGECFNGKVFSSGRPLVVKKASEDPRITYRDAKIESIVGVPISSKGTILGVLGIASHKTSFFTSMDIQLLTTIGSQLGVAIENTNLISQLRDKMSQIELTNELSSIINSSLSIGTVFRIMVSEIRKLVGYDRASLLLLNEKANNLLIFALDTEMKTVMKKGVKAPLENTSAGWAVKNNRPWINNDLGSELRFELDRKLYDEGIRSTISIPLFQDKMLGVFNLDSKQPLKYSGKDLQILLPVAKHISIALENALLFEEISREKKEWEKTFDAITDMVWIEDGSQRIIRANHTLLLKSGAFMLEISGMQCWELLEKIGINTAGCLCSDTIDTKKPSFRELKGTGGNIFHFWAYPLVDEESQLYAIVHYLKDVTAQKQLEQQLIRADKLASLGTLVAGIAHEINNPLGIIAGYSEALLDRAKDKKLLGMKGFEDFPEYLETIHNEIFRSKKILGSLLDFARSSGGTFREIDINELIKEVILLVNNKAIKLNHKIELRLNRDLPKIFADPGSLRQLFMNIIINSMYFTPEGGSIIINTEVVTNMQDIDMIRVSVSDTGTGIHNNIIGKIFDPFFTTKPVGEGTGLGLAICHKIVEEHKGSIDVKSEEGHGATFIIRLPSKAKDDKSSCG